MKIAKIVVALLVIVGISYGAYDAVRERTYEGSQLEFVAGSGSTVTLSHSGDEAAMLNITSSANFAVTSSEAELSGSGTREGSGRSAIYRREAELPSGIVDIRVTRGSNVTFALEGANPVEVVVAPMDAETSRNTVIFAVVVVLASLYFISRTLDHSWIKAIRQRTAAKNQPASQQTAVGEVGN